MLKVVVEQKTGPARRAILRGLDRFNAHALEKDGGRELAVTVHDGDAIVGGCIGELEFGWLYVKYMWLDERIRGLNHGRSVLTAIEDQARSLGGTNAYVDTFSFQARGFYEKLGYVEFGCLHGYPKGASRHFLTKAL